MIYLDNNATTRADPLVVEAMLPLLTGLCGNPSSAHAAGEAAARLVGRAREAVRALVGAASPSEIVFTSGGSEANATAVAAHAIRDDGRDEVLVSPTVHASLYKPIERLAASGVVRLVPLPVGRDGRIDPADFAARLSPRTALVALEWANGETGVIQPVAELAALAVRAGARVHCDAVQAAGRLAIDVAALGIDTLALSAHKLHGPKGVGALYVRDGVPLAPLIAGGSQERGRRAGTENVPGIVGFGRAAELCRQRTAADAPRIAGLRDRLEAGLARALSGLVVNGAAAPRLPNTASIAVPGVDGDDLALLLDREGLAVSTGSACRARAPGPSPVLVAMGLPESHIHGVLRLSLSRDTTAAEIDTAVLLIAEAVLRLGPAARSAA